MDIGLVEAADSASELSAQALEAGYLREMKADTARISALMAEARALRAAGNHAAALPILRAAATCRPKSVAILAELGVTLWGQRHVAEAATVLHAVLALDPRHAAVLGVLGRLSRHREDHAAALALFERALAERPGDPKMREEIARTLMQLDRLQDAAAQWHALVDEAPTERRFLLGYAQTLRAQGDLEPALALFRRALAQSPNDPGLLEDIGRVLMRLGRLDEAAAWWQAALDQVPANARMLLAFAQVRRSQDDPASAALLARAAIAVEPSAAAHAALGSALLRRQDQQDAAEAAFSAAVALEPDYTPALLHLGMLARSRVDDAAALAWFRRAAASAPRDPAALFEVAVSLTDLKRQDEADAVLAAIAAMPESAGHDRLRLRRLDQCCKALRLDAALDCLREFGAVADLPSQAVSLAAGLLAARGDWDDVLALFAERVVPGTGAALVPASDILAEAVARAARARGRQADVLALLESWSLAGAPAAVNLRDQLAEELLVLHRVWPEIPPPAVPPANPLRTARIARLDAALDQGGHAVSGTVFLCSDLNYLPGTVVALSSVLRHNRAALRACRFCVFLAPDAIALARPMLDRLGAAYAITIEVIAADTLGRASSGFRRDWGSFTPGHRLSDAAYYRILAALWLAGQAGAGRAVYLDSDTCVGPGMADLLRIDLAGRPLAARLEEAASGAIRRAAEKLGMAATDYFNSGVLVLDLAHPDCTLALLHAFEVAVNAPERLSYLDQCALNLAFLGRMIPLPERFNTFVRHQDDVAALQPDVVVNHYLSRPKPWDPAYGTPAGARWLDEFAALGEVLPAPDLRALMGMAFREAVTGPS